MGAARTLAGWAGAGISRRSTQRVVIYDGAFGTYMQQQGLTADDFGGPDLEGCNEMLVLTRPDLIAEMHDAFFQVGVDVVETATFGAFAVPLGEYGIADKDARDQPQGGADRAWRSPSGYDGFVAGSIGPGTKFASLGQIRFADLRDAYEVECRGLLEGGVDLLLIETQFDLLGLKAAVIGARRAMAARRPSRCRSRCRSRSSSPAACCPAPRSPPRLCAIDALQGRRRRARTARPGRPR